MRFDSLLVHYLASELDRLLAGAPVRAIRLDAPSLTCALETEAGTLLLDLHPARGTIRLAAAPPARTVLPLRRARVRSVSAPPDERLLVFELTGGKPSRPAGVVVELMGNQWNAFVLDPEERILAVLRPREAGDRRLRVGALYEQPPTSGRTGVEAPVDAQTWHALLAPLPPEERQGALVRAVAWTSPLNAGALLGETTGEADGKLLHGAWERYRVLAERPEPRPCVFEAGAALQPYPLPLPGRLSAPAESLLAAMALAAGTDLPTLAGAAPVAPELLEQIRARAAALARRIERLQAQGADAQAEALALRARGDVLLAHLHEVRRGATAATLPDFVGGTMEIELDPALAPAENATRLYDQARRRERAAARVPQLVAEAQAQRTRLLELLERASAGEATAEELTAAAGPARAPSSSEEERLPYRRYRTSGGLEVRVGRTRKDNDQLTFHASAPNDVWLHARDVAGAHVILRWPNPEGSPPHRDLTEAAVLAALHSRARTSGTVAVDWTRRKYVRKPRKAPPGLVVPERVKTIFVEPDERIEKALRASG